MPASKPNSRKAAIVVGVGAERGLGAALCRRFAAEGYHVDIAGRTPVSYGDMIRIPQTPSGALRTAAKVKVFGRRPRHA